MVYISSIISSYTPHFSKHFFWGTKVRPLELIKVFWDFGWANWSGRCPKT